MRSGPQVGAEELAAIGAALAAELAEHHARGEVVGAFGPDDVVLERGGHAHLAPGPRRPEYASPEERRGARPTAESDVATLGLVLVAVLRDEPPSEPDPASSTLLAEAAAAVPSHLRRRWRWILRRLTDSGPDLRLDAAAAAAVLGELAERHARRAQVTLVEAAAPVRATDLSAPPAPPPAPLPLPVRRVDAAAIFGDEPEPHHRRRPMVAALGALVTLSAGGVVASQAWPTGSAEIGATQPAVATETTVRPSTTTTTRRPASEAPEQGAVGEALAAAPEDATDTGSVGLLGAGVTVAHTPGQQVWSIGGGSSNPTGSYGVASADDGAVSGGSAPVATPPPAPGPGVVLPPPTSSTAPPSTPPPTTAPPTTAPPTTAPPTTAPPTTTPPPTTAPPTTAPPTTAPPTTPPPTTAPAPPTTVAPTTTTATAAAPDGPDT